MEQRMQFALESLQPGINFRGLCRRYGISAKTGYKWKERFLVEGYGGMKERSRRPRSSPSELSESMVCEIIRIKQRHRQWGPRKIRELYRVAHGEAASESSFKRVLEKAGMTEPRKRKRARTAGRIHSERVAKGANEIWSVDFKGWWYTPHGDRCEPLTVRDEYSRFVLDLAGDAQSQHRGGQGTLRAAV